MNLYSLFSPAAKLLLHHSTAQSTSDIAAVSPFDIKRYMGKWIEIARYDHPFEHGMVGVSAQYSLRGDGEVDIINSGWKNGRYKETHAVGRFPGRTSEGELEVTFFPPFHAKYRIILLDENYSCAAVTGASRDYLWILARSTRPDRKIMAEYLQKLQEWKFDIYRLVGGSECLE